MGINLHSRLQSLRGDLVDPREQKHHRKADGQQNDNQPVGPGRNLQHVKDDVYRVENEPARDQVKDPDPDNVAVFQLFEEAELNHWVMGVHVRPMMRTCIIAAVSAAILTLSPTAFTQQKSQYGSADEAKAMLMKAVAAVKADKAKALEMFNKGEGGFRDRDLYVFCNDSAGKIVAQGNPNRQNLLGQDERTMKVRTQSQCRR